MAKTKTQAADPNLAALQEAAEAFSPARPDEVLMEKDGVRTEVRNNKSVQIMEAAGWKLV
jgi:hypothetical protein